jgi:pimeloyl-ACP methyl ester carboxylesterase
MKNFLACFLILHIFICSIHAQDIEKIMKDFEKLTSNPSGIAYGNNKQAGKYYNIRGFKMYAEIYGKGQPVLFIHGNGGSINNFSYQIPYFSKTYKVIIADSRAQGKSIDKGDSLSYEMMADDYAALLDSLKIDSAFVVGWSDGGINAVLLAIRHPEKVKKLAATGTNLVPDTTAVPQEIWDMVMPAYTMLQNKPNKNEMEKNGLKLMNLLINNPHIPITDLHKISCPSLIIGGDNDVIKAEHTLLIAKNIPRSYLWILPNSGHSTPVVYKDEFNKKVNDFFSTPFRVITGAARFF